MEYLKKAKARPKEELETRKASVAEIIHNIQVGGDKALLEYNQRFDGNTRTTFRVTKDEINAAYSRMTEQELNDIRQAAEHIKAFAEAQRNCLKELDHFTIVSGSTLGHRVIPVSSCGCYVPGGSYPLFSSALMLIIPAKVAGVKRVAACSPVMKGKGKINPKTLVAMDIAGVDEIYAVGGAQAIAAFSYGTEEIAPVDMIVGPGNRFVTEAKRQCYGQVGIDFVAGPSEVLVIADGSGTPAVVAADLLAQSEHDVNAKGMLVTTDEAFGKAVIEAVEAELQVLETAEIARKSWETYGEVVVVDDIQEAVDLVNDYAPEHLELNLKNPEEVVEGFVNYGSMFIGENTAEVFGDYASGTNHTLPTLKAARYTGGVWVGTFLKTCTQQSMTAEASKKLAPLVSRLADGEGLMGHKAAADIRK